MILNGDRARDDAPGESGNVPRSMPRTRKPSTRIGEAKIPGSG